MTRHRPALAGLVAVLLTWWTLGLATATDTPPPEPSTPRAWLKGAFGRVPGGTSATPATAAPYGHPLDAWMRNAPLELTTDVPLEDVLGITVTAQPLDGGETVVLSTGASEFAAPDMPGRHLLVAVLETDTAGISEYAWLVEVPDRSGGPETLWDIPGVVALLSSTEGEVAGSPGHGCYLYLCVEAGYRPPIETLEPLRLAVGETPTLRLDDGSALVHWQGFLERAETPAERVVEAEATVDGSRPGHVQLSGLEPPSVGEWLLEVRADYDRERGWQWFLFRLGVE